MSYFGVILYQDFTAVDSNQSQVKDEEQTEQGDSEETQQVTELSEEKFENSEAENLNPFGDSTPQQQLTDKDYQNYIHQMSHQKVEAEEKWGFYLITDERIEWLLQGLDKVELGENESTYQAILERWQAGDFSQVDEDHNAIWRMQGGTIGKATGILSESAEKAFINRKE